MLLSGFFNTARYEYHSSMKITAFIIIIIILVVAGFAGIKIFNHHCDHQLREVDRYALPYVIEFMEALSQWNFDILQPWLTQDYINSLTEEEWQSAFKELSVLGELMSFARPNFVSHTPYKKYKFFTNAVDLYSIASEFDKDNAVVRIFLNNDCGNLKVRSFIVTSPSIIVGNQYSQDGDNKGDKKTDAKIDLVEELAKDDTETDLDAIYLEDNESVINDTYPEAVTKKKTTKKNAGEGATGKVYRY